MEKLVRIFQLKEGIDQDNFWKFWQDYASNSAQPQGLSRHIISRVKKVQIGDGNLMWGMSELWYENKNVYHMEAGKLAQDDFDRQLAWSGLYWMEESILVDNGYEDRIKSNIELFKVLILINLRPDVNSDQYWEFWRKTWAPSHIGPGMKKYSVNRVIAVESGDSNRMWGMAEQWHDNQATQEAEHKVVMEKRRSDPSLQQAGEKFRSQTANSLNAIMEEKLIFDRGL